MSFVRGPIFISLGALLGLCLMAEDKRPPREFAEVAREHFEQYCFDCHEGETKKGGGGFNAIAGAGGDGWGIGVLKTDHVKNAAGE